MSSQVKQTCDSEMPVTTVHRVGNFQRLRVLLVNGPINFRRMLRKYPELNEDNLEFGCVRAFFKQSIVSNQRMSET